MLKTLLSFSILLTFLCPRSYSQSYFRMSNREDYQRAKDNGWDWYVRCYQRMYIGISYPIMPVTLRTDYVGVFSNDGSHNYPVYHWHPDTTITHSTVTSGSIVLTAGTSFGLAKMGRQGLLSLNTEVTGGYVKSKNKDDFSFTFEYMALPISLEIKSGGEARLNKTRKTIFSIGAGGSLYYYLGTVSASDAGEGQIGTYGVTPFAKIEMGFLAGIAFKVGLTANATPIKFKTIASEDAAGYAPNISASTYANLTMKNGITLYLVLMPFSWDWSDDKWDY